jgi:hypothetical protein
MAPQGSPCGAVGIIDQYRNLSDPHDDADYPRRSQLRLASGGRTTPSGGVKASYRHEAEAKGHTMAGGSFPINDAEDLRKAKHDVGRARNPEAARRWINKRARDLGEPPLGG